MWAGFRLLIKLAVGAIAAATFLIALGLWWDECFVHSFQERERITSRPEPRFHPPRDWQADVTRLALVPQANSEEVSALTR
jgi:hypothetical protein